MKALFSNNSFPFGICKLLSINAIRGFRAESGLGRPNNAQNSMSSASRKIETTINGPILKKGARARNAWGGRYSFELQTTSCRSSTES
jgi:hypothetical protein